MLDSVAAWLDQVGTQVFWTCAVTLVLVDAAALGVVVLTRSRSLVNRWTGPVLAANLFLLGAGVGVPVVAFTAKFVASALSPSLSARQAKDIVPDPGPVAGAARQP